MGVLMIQQLDIAILKGHWYNPMTHVIYQRTSSWYTHGTVLLGQPIRIIHPKTLKWIEGDQIEATEGGVQLTWFKKYDGRTRKILRYWNEILLDRAKMLKWLLSKIGCKYEYLSYLGYLTGFKTDYLDDPNKFVCVELASEMFTQAGIDIWGCEKPTYIYPSDLLQNNCFKEVS
jgi:hypothetical protein